MNRSSHDNDLVAIGYWVCVFNFLGIWVWVLVWVVSESVGNFEKDSLK